MVTPERIQLGLLGTSIAMLSAGCALAWLPLGLIVPGGLILTGLVWVRLQQPAAELPNPEDEA